ncbi:MAG: hypothetical protein LQ352_002179 [Teloschistes flavicans]|nr:MAG: hypothetical protein LQ352_002179 [Teloschistes flavicans]
MKRKRGSGDDLEPQAPSLKRQPDQLSHVNIPIAVNERSSIGDRLTPDAGSQDKVIVTQPSYQDRTERLDWDEVQRNKQSFLATAARANPSPAHEQPSHVQVPTTKAMGPSLDQLQQTIEAQFNLEILLKHRELRLVDQEIAKCQIALEQLRRCQVIPYPAMSSSWEDMQAVSSGQGPAQENPAQHAPPWGVTSGPYTRHYQRWLIPDDSFGDVVPGGMHSSQSTNTFSERAVRASTAGKSHLANKSRSQRGAVNTRLKSIPYGYPEPKEDKGPMLLKRSTDGQMVKLVCLDCRRSDFNSVQGFINHCRIAHSRNFQSHDAAAIACGEEVELDQAGGLVGETSTPVNSGAGLVHPLIRSAHAAKLNAPTPSMLFPKRESSITPTPSHSLSTAAFRVETAHREGVPEPMGSSAPRSSFFKASANTPHLSALFAKLGRGGDLDEEVSEAKTKMDIDSAMSSGDEDEDEEPETPQPLGGPPSHSTRGLVRPDHALSHAAAASTLTNAESLPSAQPPKARSHKPKGLAPLAPHPPDTFSMHLRGPAPSRSSHPPVDRSKPIHDSPSSPNFSPNTTESHQAPSLVSDDDDIENTHSECSSSADVAEDLERHYFGMDFDNQEDQMMADLEGTGGSAGPDQLGLGARPKASGHLGQTPRRPSAMRSPDAVREAGVHNSGPRVSFQSPVRRPRKKGGK